MKILKEIKKAASSQSCAKNKYYGCGAVLTRIAYEVVGMTDSLRPMQEDSEILKGIEQQRQHIHRPLQERAHITQKGDSDEEESSSETSQPKHTILMGGVHVPTTTTEGKKQSKKK